MRLGTVFVSGVAFLVLTLLKLRSWLANSISPSLKHSFGVGIGLFLMFLGMYQTGVVASFVTGKPYLLFLVPDSQILRAPDVPVTIGHIGAPRVLLAIFGFLV